MNPRPKDCWKPKPENLRKNKTSHRLLIDRLDKIFSIFIRLKNADTNGMVRCITSGKFLHWKDADAGHFITRNNMATRWNEQNVNPQSRGDNRFLSGRQYEHGLSIDRRHGVGTAEKLLIKSKGQCKFHDFELQSMIKHYKDQVKNLMP